MNIRVLNYLLVDMEHRLATVSVMSASETGKPPMAVLANAHAVFRVDTGECLKWRDAGTRPTLNAYLTQHGVSLETVPKAQALATKAHVGTVYAYADAASGFYCGYSMLDAS